MLPKIATALLVLLTLFILLVIRTKLYVHELQQTGYANYIEIRADQAELDKDCKDFTTPTFLTFGECVGQFIYCSGKGVNRMAACPIGKTFDIALRACSDTCGSSLSIATKASALNGTTQEPLKNQPTTKAVQVKDACSSGSKTMISLGCSQQYIKCVSGSAKAQTCEGSLYFNRAQQSCTHKFLVPECVETQESTTYTRIVRVEEERVVIQRVFPAPSPYETYTTTKGPSKDTTTTPSPLNNQPTTQSAQVKIICLSGAKKFISLGCSQKFIHCVSGSAEVRSCESPFYFDEATQLCKYRDQVAECKAQRSTKHSPNVALKETTTKNPDIFKQSMTFDATKIFGETIREYYIQEYEQNGLFPLSRFGDRQAQLSRDCLGFTSPTFITFGDCFDWFIYCSGNGVNRMAACPIGETFNKALGSCSKTCGAVTNGSSNATSKATTRQASPICLEGQVASLGMCSSSFTQCQNNTVLTKRCPARTLLESSLAFCVFDLPQCHPTSGPLKPQLDDRRKDQISQDQVDKKCQGFTTPIFLSPGDCADRYIYCSGKGVNKWDLCPMGTFFSRVLRGCSDACLVRNVKN